MLCGPKPAYLLFVWPIGQEQFLHSKMVENNQTFQDPWELHKIQISVSRDGFIEMQPRPFF